MKGEVLIKAENVSKKFAKSLKKSLYYGVLDLISGITGKDQKKNIREDEFWAVKDISFEVKRGECLGLIGHNGAGKSTLLKMLSGLIAPDQGTITIKGKIGALIELGAGFNPILSGRENIYNNAAVIGFTKKEIDQKLDAIIAFAELEEFIDMPVQNYSSGMKVRLGFAIAAQMEPDVLIIDEVLAVGDLGFILKCFKQIDKLLPHTAVIFVSHSMPMISRVASQILLLGKGETEYMGDKVGKGIDIYYNRFVDNESTVFLDDGVLELKKIQIQNVKEYYKGVPIIKWGDDLNLFFKIIFKKKQEVPLFRIIINDKEQKPVGIFQTNTLNCDLAIEDNQMIFYLFHEKIQLSKGFYSIDLSVFKFNTNNPIYRINNVLSFQVVHEEDVWPPFLLNASYSNAKS